MYQVKRSGDWLQALSCLDTEREYNNTKVDLKNITLITFDRILLIYSLFLGINVLYTAKGLQGQVIYFKTPALPAIRKNLPSAANGNAMHHSRIEEINKRLQGIMIRNNLPSAMPAPAANGNAMRHSRIEEINKRLEEIMSVRVNNDALLRDLRKERRNLEKEKRKMEGGGSEKTLCDKYILQLARAIEAFESDENPDYEYYENVALIVLLCLFKETSYEILQSIFFNILPSIEGKIETNEEELIQFFTDKYIADCTSFAARNIALNSIGLRTGTLKSLGIKYSIPFNTVEFTKFKDLMPPEFEKRQKIIIELLHAHSFAPQALNRSNPLPPNTRVLVSVAGRRKITRRKSKKPHYRTRRRMNIF